MSFADLSSRIIEPFLYKNVIKDKSSNILFEINKLKKEGLVYNLTEPYEGVSNAYYTIIQYNDKYYLYYRGLPHPSFKNASKTAYFEHFELVKYECFCLAESDDGLNFVKKDYNIIKNKYIRDGINGILKWDNYCHNFYPYYSKKDNKFYGISGVSLLNGGLYLHESKDGIIWKTLNCIIKENLILSNWSHNNHFDTHNSLIYKKNEDMYYLFLRHNNKRYRSVQFTKTKDFKTFTNCKEININNLEKQHIYSPSIFEYPNSNYIIGLPTLGNEKIKHCNSIIISDNCQDWDIIGNNFFDNEEKMGVSGIVYSKDKEKMYLYVNNNNLYDINNVECYSFPFHRLNKIICKEDNGFLITNEICLQSNKLWINFETLNDYGSIDVELFKDNKCIKKSKKYNGDKMDLLIEWSNEPTNNENNENNNDINNLIKCNIKFNLNNCCLYSFAYTT